MKVDTFKIAPGDNEIVISYRKYKISDTDYGSFLRVESNRKSIFFGSVILPRVVTLIATSKLSKHKFKYIEVDTNPIDEFNIGDFKDVIEVQGRLQ